MLCLQPRILYSLYKLLASTEPSNTILKVFLVKKTSKLHDCFYRTKCLSWRQSMSTLNLQTRDHWYPCFLVRGFKARVGSLTCVLHHLHMMDSSDSPLVWYLLTCWWPVWHLSHFIYILAYKHWWGSSPGSSMLKHYNIKYTLDFQKLFACSYLWMTRKSF